MKRVVCILYLSIMGNFAHAQDFFDWNKDTKSQLISIADCTVNQHISIYILTQLRVDTDIIKPYKTTALTFTMALNATLNDQRMLDADGDLRPWTLSKMDELEALKIKAVNQAVATNDVAYLASFVEGADTCRAELSTPFSRLNEEMTPIE